MQEFRDKVAVVTGAGSGIGLATATRFAAEGMKVVLADIDPDALAAAESSLRESGHEVLAVRTDVSKLEQIEALADRTMQQFGAVHVVHNNAGVVRAGALDELTLEDWQWVLNVDLWSVIHGVRVFLPLVKRAGQGHFINTASSNGLQATANIGPYGVAKFGVVALTETLKLEMGEAGLPIGASVLCPGAVRTRICESDRTRALTGMSPGDITEAERSFNEAAGAIVNEGMDPAAVAELVMQAIVNNDFWILTHRDWLGVMHERVEGMAQNKLVTGFGG